MAVQFRNLVFEGGGVKGIAYVGAMRVMEQRGALRDIRRVGGTSAGAIMSVQENQHLHEDDWHRTLHIDTLDVNTTDFDLSDEKKAALIQSGIDCAENYFKWFENPAEAPCNRV